MTTRPVPLVDRRSLLGGLLALPAAWSLPGFGARRGKRRLLLVWLDGGMSHVDTFDGKPEASVDVRGDLGSVPAAGLDGVFVSEHLPLLAARLQRCALIRSLTHGEGNHDRGSHLLLTGRRPSPVLQHPSLGAMREGGPGEPVLPPYVAIPDAPAEGGAGFLSAAQAPFLVEGDPGRPDFAVRHLDPPKGDRHARSLALASRLDDLAGAPRGDAEALRDRFRRQAVAMAGDAEVRAAFDLAAEAPEVRQRYGRHRLGQSCLLARRLLRHGCATVLVRDVGWDHHVDIRRALTYGFPPKLVALDQALAALLDDLDADAALGGEVLVVLASEFGRTPRLNARGGRDHWPRAQSVLLYGAGIRRGAVVGETDARGEEPARDPVAAADLFATLWTALGEDPARVLHTADGRPVRAVEEGAAPIRAVLA